MNDNRFIGNRLSHNNVVGDPDAALTKTANIIVFGGGGPITGTVARGNLLANAFFGVWTKNAHTRVADNQFVNVAHRVHQE